MHHSYCCNSISVSCTYFWSSQYQAIAAYVPLKVQHSCQWCQFHILSVQSRKNKFENHSSCNTLLQCLTYPSMPLSCSSSLSGHRCSTPSSPTLSRQLVRFSLWCAKSTRHPWCKKHGLGESELCAIFSFMADDLIIQILYSIYSANKGALNQKSRIIYFIHEDMIAMTFLANYQQSRNQGLADCASLHWASRDKTTLS